MLTKSGSTQRKATKRPARKPSSARYLPAGHSSIRKSSTTDSSNATPLSDVDKLSSFDSDGNDVPRITTISVDVGVHTMADEPSDVSADETTKRCPARQSRKGDYVLVTFAKKQRRSYYAGKIVQFDSSDDDRRVS